MARLRNLMSKPTEITLRTTLSNYNMSSGKGFQAMFTTLRVTGLYIIASNPYEHSGVC
jgi:hypothetical protein